ncbi:MAG: hypothetical protein JKY45_04825 [Emcibacter sp.]|nr:hypothetical protein [Emcibacter sp.]
MLINRAVVPIGSVGAYKAGHGNATGHHGEIIQGAMRNQDRIIHRFLVTLPCNELYTQARFEPSLQLAGHIIVPDDKAKSRMAIEITLKYLNRSDFGGQLHLRSNIEKGFGMGSSTTDVVATIRAVADAFGRPLLPEIVAHLAVAAETASDAIMFEDNCVMFAQRRGVVLEYLGSGLPPLHVLSINTARDAPLDTVATPAARYSDWELQSFCALSGMIRRAIRTGDPYLLGRVATASATISQRHIPKPAFEEIQVIARANDACGVQVSHSGTVVGLLFNAFCPNLNVMVESASKDLSSIGMAPDFRFSTLHRRHEYAS